jgi:alpha-D-ribose 1-methylphosphonate 5-triphosphate diphosphatase
MAAEPARYALYFAPAPDSALWRFGSGILGYDAATGEEVPLVPFAGFSETGQRQWRNLGDLKTFAVGGGAKTVPEFERDVARRMAEGPAHVAENRPRVIAMFRDRGLPLATHDDTTLADVEDAAACGAVISEFPTTEEAAAAAHRHKLSTILGGPNIVRGGSHSSGVSAALLAEKGLLDGISSDYVPASLLQAVEILTRRHGITLPDAMAKVTWRIADMVGLADRGRLKPGLRADILRFRFVGQTPVVTESFCAGRRAF